MLNRFPATRFPHTLLPGRPSYQFLPYIQFIHWFIVSEIYKLDSVFFTYDIFYGSSEEFAGDLRQTIPSGSRASREDRPLHPVTIVAGPA
jgi:hypothetical protein